MRLGVPGLAVLVAFGAIAMGPMAPPADAQSGPDAGIVLPTLPGLWTPSDGDRLDFDVFRNGDKFGRHTVVFRKQGDRLIAKTDIELKVAVGPLTLYHYVHDAEETWVGGQLSTLTARTKNGGRWNELLVSAADGGLKVTGKAFKGVIDASVIPSSHWNKRQMMQTAMLSTDTGQLLPMKVTDKGIEKVKVGGREIAARHFFVKSDIEVSFWYDDAGRWVKCAFEAEGSKIEYVLRALPA